MKRRPISSIVATITQLHFEGNVIPHSWFQEIRKPRKMRGKDQHTSDPDILGILIIADIIYWYRATTTIDEKTSRVTGHRQKFRGDMLQKSYWSYAEQFGVSKWIIKQAIDRLDGHLLRRVIKPVVRTEEGEILSNVMYLEPIPGRIREITYSTFNTPQSPIVMGGDPPSLSGRPPYSYGGRSPIVMGGVPPSLSTTYTENQENRENVRIKENSENVSFFSPSLGATPPPQTLTNMVEAERREVANKKGADHG